MYQWALSFIYIISLFFSLATTVAFAQSFGNPPPTPAPGSALSVMSADDFKKTVDALSQKNQEKLTQDMKDQFQKRATLPAATKTAPSAAAPDALPPQTTTSGPLTGTPPSTEPASNPELLTTAPATPTSTPSRSPSSQATITTTPPPAQSSVYTGFGSGNTHKKTPTNTNPSSQETGGWNIKY